MIPESTLEHLRLREGVCMAVYEDTTGNPTGGVGHKLSPVEAHRWAVGDSLPEPLVEQWLEDDATVAWSAACEQAQEAGNWLLIEPLFHVCFQLGTHWNLEHIKTWALIVEMDYKSAAIEAADSRWYHQTPVRVEDLQQSLNRLAKT